MGADGRRKRGRRGGFKPDESLTKERRMQTRRMLRQLSDGLEEKAEELRAAPTSEGLVDVVTAVEQSKDVQYARERVLAADVIRDASHIGKGQADNLSRNLQSFEVSTMVSRAKQEYSRDGEFDWLAFGRSVGCFFLTAPPARFLSGLLDVPVKVRQRRARVAKDRVEAVEEAGADAVEEAAETAFTTERVVAMTNTLVRRAKDGQSLLPFAETLLHGKDFSQAVENLFDASCLVKEDKLQLSLKDGLPYVGFVSGEPTESSERHAAVVTLSMASWRNAVKAFGVEEGIIPHRTRPHEFVRGDGDDDDESDGHGDDDEDDSDDDDHAAAAHRMGPPRKRARRA